jgi:hypothetical protein
MGICRHGGGKGGPYLECRDQVGRLEQGQLADLVDNGRNLGVGGRRGVARLPPPLYPLLCSSDGGPGVRGGAGTADAAPQGARCGGGHCGLRVRGAEGRWMGGKASLAGRQCSRLGFRYAERRRRSIGCSAEHVWVRAKKDVRELRHCRREPPLQHLSRVFQRRNYGKAPQYRNTTHYLQ